MICQLLREKNPFQFSVIQDIVKDVCLSQLDVREIWRNYKQNVKAVKYPKGPKGASKPQGRKLKAASFTKKIQYATEIWKTNGWQQMLLMNNKKEQCYVKLKSLQRLLEEREIWWETWTKRAHHHTHRSYVQTYWFMINIYNKYIDMHSTL